MTSVSLPACAPVRMTVARMIGAGWAALLLAGCQPSGSDAGSPAAPAGNATIPDPNSTEPYAGIGEGETVHFTGTEPFWGGEVAGGLLTYTTPENPDGARIAVERFAGRGGLSYGGTFEGADFEMTVTALECSDGMSDRTYPFTVSLKIGDDLREGCGWSDRQPFAGSAHP